MQHESVIDRDASGVRRRRMFAFVLCAAALGCADRSPPARFPETPPPEIAKPLPAQAAPDTLEPPSTREPDDASPEP